jgi:hypothetical protein
LLAEYRSRGFSDSLGNKLVSKILVWSKKFDRIANDKKAVADELNRQATGVKLKFGSRVAKTVDDLLMFCQNNPMMSSMVLALLSFFYSASAGIGMLVVPALIWFLKYLKKKFHGKNEMWV